MHGAYALPDLRGASILIVDDFVVDRGVADRADLVRWIRGYDREHQRLTAVIASHAGASSIRVRQRGPRASTDIS